MPTALRIKTRAQFRRHNRTQILALPEHPITNPRHEVIHKIAHPPRYHAKHRCQRSPPAAQSSKNMQERCRPHQQLPVPRQHHHAIRQSRPPLRPHPRQKRLTLQRRKPKHMPATIVPQDELHRAMAKSAMSIVKKIFRGRRVRLHQKSIARAPGTLTPASCARHSTPRRAQHKFLRAPRIAVAETQRPSLLPAFTKISKLV
jgi:hypothetical protein